MTLLCKSPANIVSSCVALPAVGQYTALFISAPRTAAVYLQHHGQRPESFKDRKKNKKSENSRREVYE